MESEKRKRSGNGGVAERRTRMREENNNIKEGQTATEDEVEEFFAILRRVHTAVRYFKNGKVDGRNLTEKGCKWTPSFDLKDFEEATGNGVKVREKREGVEENMILDLNADPDTETNTG